LAKFEQQLAHAKSGFENLKTSVVPAFNQQMQGTGITIKTEN
jgi:hypothetical protein